MRTGVLNFGDNDIYALMRESGIRTNMNVKYWKKRHLKQE
jgi:hypothetical protein